MQWSPAFRRALAEVDPTVTLWRTQTLDESIDEQLAQPRLSTVLMSGFGFVALLLTAVGLYGVMTLTVREETHDIGVRMALGATAQQLRRDVLRRALIVVLSGAIVGLGVALIATRLVRSLLFDISPVDPVAILAACGLLVTVGLVAAYLPAATPVRSIPLERYKQTSICRVRAPDAQALAGGFGRRESGL